MNFTGLIELVAYIVTESLINSLWQGILLVAITIFILHLARKLNATTRYLILWLTLLFLAFIPLIKFLPITVQSISLIHKHPTNQEIINSDNHLPASLKQGNDISPSDKKDPKQIFISGLLRTKFVEVPIPLKILSSIIFALWGIITIFKLSKLLRSHLYIVKLKRDLLELPPEGQIKFDELIRSTGIKKEVNIYISNNIRMPIVIGLFKPLIIIPDNLTEELTEEQFKQVILHELAHVRRWDNWTNLIQRVIEAFYFWHPMVLCLGRRLNLEREIACDSWVIALSGKPKSYALCLTRLIEFNMVMSGHTMAAGAALYKKHVTKRIMMLLDKGYNTTAGFSRFAILLAVFVIIPSFAVFTSIAPVIALIEPKTDDLKLSPQSERANIREFVSPLLVNGLDPELGKKIEKRTPDKIEKDDIAGKLSKMSVYNTAKTATEGPDRSKISQPYMGIQDDEPGTVIVDKPDIHTEMMEKTVPPTLDITDDNHVLNDEPGEADIDPAEDHIDADKAAGNSSTLISEASDDNSELKEESNETQIETVDAHDSSVEPAKDNVPKLLRAVNNSSKEIQAEAVESLARVKDSSQDAISTAIEIADDKSNKIRNKVGSALSEIKEPAKNTLSKIARRLGRGKKQD
jgi:beta-lactamase regulating signal transducer with metallopeptidase domain